MRGSISFCTMLKYLQLGMYLSSQVSKLRRTRSSWRRIGSWYAYRTRGPSQHNSSMLDSMLTAEVKALRWYGQRRGYKVSQFAVAGFDYSSRYFTGWKECRWISTYCVWPLRDWPPAQFSSAFYCTCARLGAERTRDLGFCKFIIDNPSLGICTPTSLRCWVDFPLTLGNVHCDSFLSFIYWPMSE